MIKTLNELLKDFGKLLKDKNLALNNVIPKLLIQITSNLACRHTF